MSEAAVSRRPFVLVSLALALLVALVVAPRAVAHPGAQLEEAPPGIGVLLAPGTDGEQFLPGFQYSGTPPVDGQEAPFVFVGNGCTLEGYAGADVEGRIAPRRRSSSGWPTPSRRAPSAW
jgi:hypothetical protein